MFGALGAWSKESLVVVTQTIDLDLPGQNVLDLTNEESWRVVDVDKTPFWHTWE